MKIVMLVAFCTIMSVIFLGIEIEARSEKETTNLMVDMAKDMLVTEKKSNTLRNKQKMKKSHWGTLILGEGFGDKSNSYSIYYTSENLPKEYKSTQTYLIYQEIKREFEKLKFTSKQRISTCNIDFEIHPKQNHSIGNIKIKGRNSDPSFCGAIINSIKSLSGKKVLQYRSPRSRYLCLNEPTSFIFSYSFKLEDGILKFNLPVFTSSKFNK